MLKTLTLIGSALLLTACAGDISIRGYINPAMSRQVVQQIKNYSAPTMVVELDSPGGYNKDGYEIIAALDEAKSRTRVITHVSRRCYSMCVAIFLAGQERTADSSALFMIHRSARGEQIDYDESIKMVQYFAERGVNPIWINEKISRGKMFTTGVGADHYFTAAEMKVAFPN